MIAHELAASTWEARLDLCFERRGARTVLARNAHYGPLRLQKALYPEGEGVCHGIVLHPPAGVAGGDRLELAARLDSGAHALLTTPGAGKWYRSKGPRAAQTLAFDVAPGAVLEWLPQETIVFDAALADLSCRVNLGGDAVFFGMDILCLGRTGSGERFTRGQIGMETRIERDGRPIWLERGRLEGGGGLLQSPLGLAGNPVAGSFIAAATGLTRAHLEACRGVTAQQGEGAVTLLPDLLIARYLGGSGAAARAYFTAIWDMLRLPLCGRRASPPRIWST
ncbi:MAG: urease accessory protein UreD [Rhodocyclaceae bacterium]|nr:urease accessory protein UreD [Rhodocyclaceae bacterium]MBX3669984.1 urease accessory protein UreD [Rhodocyclaceae bacterium]